MEHRAGQPCGRTRAGLDGQELARLLHHGAICQNGFAGGHAPRAPARLGHLPNSLLGFRGAPPPPVYTACVAGPSKVLEIKAEAATPPGESACNAGAPISSSSHTATSHQKTLSFLRLSSK